MMWKQYNSSFTFTDNKLYMLGMHDGSISLCRYKNGTIPYFEVLLKDGDYPECKIYGAGPGAVLFMDLNFVMEYPEQLPAFRTVEDEQGVTHFAECHIDINEPYYTYAYEVVQLGYNPEYGDDKICKCGHAYHRHFDFWETPPRLGCKYCSCERFELRTLEHEPKCELCGAPLDDPQVTLCPHCLAERAERNGGQ